MIPAQAPYEGEEPTMRKGSYSEESVRMSSIGMVSTHTKALMQRCTRTSCR